MAKDTFPFWGPGSPQRPNNIPGRGVKTMLQDLAVNQIPRGRSDEIAYIPHVVPIIRPPEQPADPSFRMKGKTGSNLYQLFLMTETMPREEVARAGGMIEEATS